MGAVGSVVGDGLVDGDRLGVDDGVRIRPQRDVIATGLQHVGAAILDVIGRHVVVVEGYGDGLRRTRCQQFGLVIGDQVDRGLLNAAFGEGGLK